MLAAALAAAVLAHGCFGAAARDPVHPCRGVPAGVVPSPQDALIQPSEPCAPVRSRAPRAVCAFGVPRAQAVGSFALVGDSHAVHWRAALAVVARARRWRGYTLSRSRCPYAALVKATSRRDSAACARWNRQVLAWFRAHPGVHTVFVSQRRFVASVLRPGLGSFATRVAALVAAWKALPPSVTHIVVIRDDPYARERTGACVARALRRGQRANGRCAIPRGEALKPDPALAAAAQIGAPRVSAIDLSRFMCDAHRCYPVIGGVLVHKDVGHLTRTFSTTLGPYLLRALR